MGSNYTIGGVVVKFPYEAYQSQIDLMQHVITTLDSALNNGQSHGLLESPTGTGKTLSLLCSILAWREHKFNSPTSRPKVFYVTRTHSQVTQAVREYKKSPYRAEMAILGSREHYCINADAREHSDGIDSQCHKLTSAAQCGLLRCAFKVRGHLLDIRRADCHDIEDVVSAGKAVHGCPYYGVWNSLEHAELIFCPYNYLLNPYVRTRLAKYLKKSIIIFDEAHNLEASARESGSIDFDESSLIALNDQLIRIDKPEFKTLHDIIKGMIELIGRNKDSLSFSEQHYRSWGGDNAVSQLEQCHITPNNFQNVLPKAREAIRGGPDEPPGLKLQDMQKLERLLFVLEFFFTGDNKRHYRLCLQRPGAYSKTYNFSLWCMKPAVIFRYLVDTSFSIMLTSGTLSPRNSFSSELGVQFDTCVEAKHVIDEKCQVWAGVISKGFDNVTLNATSRNTDKVGFQDALGKTLQEIISKVPSGSLVFFPSYGLMEKLCTRWKDTGLWSQLNLCISTEPRRTEELDSELKRYYGSVSSGRKATFLAVCRGKVAEGIDFSDDKARAVIIVGVPYPSTIDSKVLLKKSYNDANRRADSLLSGDDWYCLQAYRAVNQAAGRCIRHKNDYGAIIFLDARYSSIVKKAGAISNWLSKSVNSYDDFGSCLNELDSFFKADKPPMISISAASTSRAGEAADLSQEIEDPAFLDAVDAMIAAVKAEAEFKAAEVLHCLQPPMISISAASTSRAGEAADLSQEIEDPAFLDAVDAMIAAVKAEAEFKAAEEQARAAEEQARAAEEVARAAGEEARCLWAAASETNPEEAAQANE